MFDNTNDLLVRLEKAQREYPDTHVLIGQTRTALESLQTKVEEMTAALRLLASDKPMVSRGVSYICYDALELKNRIAYARAALKEGEL